MVSCIQDKVFKGHYIRSKPALSGIDKKGTINVTFLYLQQGGCIVPNQASRVINAVVQGAEVKSIKGLGFFVLEKGPKRTRRTRAEMEKDEKNHKKN